MNLRRTFLFVLPVILHSSSQAQDVTVHADSATMDVQADVNGLPVYLDGERIGKTPLHRFRISTGPHEVLVASPYGPAWNQPVYKSSFVAVPEMSYTFRASFRRNILINSIPFGAAVYVDDARVGETPVQISDRGRELRLQVDGYQTYTTPLAGVDGLSLLIRLVPDPEWLKARVQREMEKERRLRRSRHMMMASIGFTALAGLSTIHYRSRGNSAYSDYMESAHPDDMDRHFKKAEKFDRIAGITYAFFEFGFVATGYFFLTSRP